MQLEDGEMPRMVETKRPHTASSYVKLPTKVILTAPAEAEETIIHAQYEYGKNDSKSTEEAAIRTGEVELTQPLAASLDTGTILGPEYTCIMITLKIRSKATVQFDFQMPRKSCGTFQLRVDNGDWLKVTLKGDRDGPGDWLRIPYEWPMEAGEHKLCVSACDVGVELARVRGTNGVCMARKLSN